MTVSTRFLESDNKAVITIAGEFNFQSHKAFLKAVRSTPKASSYEVDLTEVTAVDSSALGMLLILRDIAGGDSAQVSLHGANDDLKNIFQLTKFSNLFHISNLYQSVA